MTNSKISTSGLAAFAYGIVSYGVFFAVFLYAVGFIAGFLTPTTLDGPADRPIVHALLVNIGLLGLFAVQHSLMARPAFKRWWTRIVPESVERSTYVLLSSLALVALFIWWEPIGGVIWNTAGAGRTAVIGLNLFGWALLLYATFLIDHFDLFGLKQVWRRLTGHSSYVAPQFYTPGLYRLVRHPIYVGWLVIFWAAPTMTVAHLVFALATTAYILIAIQLEEHDLVATFGDRYRDYRRVTPMLIPRLWPSRNAR